MNSKLETMVFAGLLSVALTACDEEQGNPASAEECDDDHGHDHDHDHDDDHGEVEGACPAHDEGHGVTTVTLTFTPETGEVVTASFRDPDGPGGASGTGEHLHLAPNTTYAVGLELLAELDEDEDITALMADRAEGHFIFFHGPKVSGPASRGDGFLVHEFDDLESDYTENEVGEDLPLGLASIVTTSDTGEAELRVIVRHVPVLNDVPQKTAGLPDAFARGEEVAGSNDVDVVFEVEVE